jgi:hypothetical protein
MFTGIHGSILITPRRVLKLSNDRRWQDNRGLCKDITFHKRACIPICFSIGFKEVHKYNRNNNTIYETTQVLDIRRTGYYFSWRVYCRVFPVFIVCAELFLFSLVLRKHTTIFPASMRWIHNALSHK